jgi:hypothetical protein
MVIAAAPIFPDASPDAARVRALTPAGSIRFEQARLRLAKLATREPEQVNDADVVEYLARGETATRTYLAS